MKLRYLIALLAGILLLWSGNAFAANCGGATACSCGDTVTSDYTLSANLSCTNAGAALTIGAANVDIDLNGKTISGDGVNTTYGIYASNYDNFSLTNGTVHDFTLAGIGINFSTANCTAFTIDSVAITSSYRGIDIIAVKNNHTLTGGVITNNVITSPDREGILAKAGDDTPGEYGQINGLTIRGNTITGTGNVTASEGQGIQISLFNGRGDDCFLLRGIDIDGNTITNSASNAILMTAVQGTGAYQSYVRNNTISTAGYGDTQSINAVRLAMCDDVLVYGNSISGTLSSTTGDGNAIIIDNLNGTATLTDDWTWTNGSKQVDAAAAGGNATSYLTIGTKVSADGGSSWYTVDSVTDDNQFFVTSNFSGVTGDYETVTTSWCWNVQVYKNTLHSNRDGNGSGVSILSGKSSDIFYNVMYGNVRGVMVQAYLYGHSTLNTIYNNTIYGNTDLGAHSGDGIYIWNSAPEVTIKNNAIFDMSGYGINEDATNPDSDFNVIYGCDDGAVNGFTIGSNSIESDPLFVDPTNGRLDLQAGSPCIDAGQ